jgi:hypothetical protein
MIYVGIAPIGIAAGISLLIGLNQKSPGKLIFWICFKGLEAFHQFFFSFEVIVIVIHKQLNDWILLVTFAILIFALATDIYFITRIVKIYQEFIALEVSTWAPRSTWRVPTISELLGDECAIGESDPPAWRSNTNGDRTRSYA